MEAADRTAGSPDNREKRRRRVKRMKTAIILIIIALLLIPTVCCIILFAKMSHMQKQLDVLLEAHSRSIPEADGMTDTVQTVVRAAQRATEPAVTLRPEPAEETEAQLGKNAGRTPEFADEQIEGKKVYLTFDDGPSSHTDQILDILAENQIKATFFVIGKTDEASKKAYRRIVKEGHTLGMHSYSHKYSTLYESEAAFREDFRKLSDLLYEVTGMRPSFYRFPGGSSNTVSRVDMDKLISWCSENGITYFDWNAACGDALGKELTVKQMVRNTADGVERYESSVVLLHDTAAKETTLKALPSIIEALQKKDAVFLPITEQTRPVQHRKAEAVKQQGE